LIFSWLDTAVQLTLVTRSSTGAQLQSHYDCCLFTLDRCRPNN